MDTLWPDGTEGQQPVAASSGVERSSWWGQGLAARAGGRDFAVQLQGELSRETTKVFKVKVQARPLYTRNLSLCFTKLP